MTQKNSLPIIAAIVAILAIGGGAMYYFSNMKKDGAGQEASAPAAGEESSTASSTSSSTSGEPAASAAEEQEATAAAGKIDGVDVKPGNPVVASVDGKDITRVDVFRYIKLMPQNVQQLPPAAIYPLALDQVVNTRLVQNKAEEAGLESDPEVKQQLDLAKQQIIRSIYVQRAVDKEISEGDLKKAYDEYVAKVPEVAEIKASHILVADESKAKDLITQLEGGADFAKLAAANSGDPGNKDKGGDLGWFAKQDMVPEFADAAFKINKGEISKTPVKTQFGWHVVKVEDKRDRPRPSYEEMKPMLQVELRRQKLETMLADWRKDAKIATYDINGDPVKEAPAVAPAAGDAAPAPAPAAEAPAAAPAPEPTPAPAAEAPAETPSAE